MLPSVLEGLARTDVHVAATIDMVAGLFAKRKHRLPVTGTWVEWVFPMFAVKRRAAMTGASLCGVC